MRPGTDCRRVLLALCVSGVSSAVSCTGTAPVTMPDTPAGHTLRAWLDAYNAADSAGIEAYVQRYEPAMSVHTQLVFRDQTGVLQLVSVERNDLRHLEIILRSARDSVHKYSSSTMMYGVVDLAEGSPPRAKTSLTQIGSAAAPVRRINAAERAMAIDSLIAKLVRNYVFPDVAVRVADSLRARRARGAYDDYSSEISFAHRLNGDLLTLSGDKQMNVEYAWRVPLPFPVPAPPALQQHCGFERARMLEDSIGYLAFYGFSEPEMDCGHEVSEAMSAVAASRALIIDLRENQGGSRSMMAYLASYLVAECTQLSEVWDRRTDHTEKSWTFDGPQGPAFGVTRPLYILTSVRTFSAAEEFAYALKALGRATIVGETTAGAAHLPVLGQIGAHLLVRVPVARTINPTTGTNWQGVGVQPDVSVPASEALATARRMFRERENAHGSTTAKSSNRVRAIPIAADLVGAADLSPRLRGIRFAVDTIEASAGARGLLTRVGGVAEFANGRGRLDVVAVRPATPVSLNGITIAEPLAKPGDYYLFDNSGFILVRPAARTFSSFVFTRADFNQTGALLPGAFMFKDIPVHTDTLTDGNGARAKQHAPVSIHWHMQPSNGGALYARGWLEILDAPPEEAGIARWFEVAAALATRPGASPVTAKGLEVTSVVLLRRPSLPEYQVRYTEALFPRGLSDTEVDPLRLVLPPGYVETSLARPDVAPIPPAPLQTNASRWRTLDDSSTQRRHATCRAPWLPALGGRTP